MLKSTDKQQVRYNCFTTRQLINKGHLKFGPINAWRYGNAVTFNLVIAVLEQATNKSLVDILRKDGAMKPVSKNQNKEKQKVYCGIDFHKNESMLYALAEDGRVVLGGKNVKSSNLVRELVNCRDWVLGIEATGGSNHMASELRASGHEVTLIETNQFHAIGVNGKKTDLRDAKAIATALRLGSLPTVHLKSLYAREIKSLLVGRELAVRARVNSTNHIRGTLREYGITLPAGPKKFLMAAPQAIAKIQNGFIRAMLEQIFQNVIELKQEEQAIDNSMQEMVANDLRVKTLTSAPGVGFLTACAFIAVVDDINRFKDSRVFASFLGLVPSVSASANKVVMGRITRSGPEILRRYYIHGARAWMKYSVKGDPNRKWAEQIKSRRGMNKAIVALAHKMCRISYAMIKHNKPYEVAIQIEKNEDGDSNATKAA